MRNAVPQGVRKKLCWVGVNLSQGLRTILSRDTSWRARHGAGADAMLRGASASVHGDTRVAAAAAASQLQQLLPHIVERVNRDEHPEAEELAHM
eukprot:CAMPEP_0181215454 /NCGR_PEP_ID=MMETSP1096-20121128/26025_1 /TAXON_ID=156174 ORGANISM="Chrysochromulina ericina, Strain CCMP281" /NCGR_SAMPLE_ID=MMETSP1096 /ASSEMBLY_ACC=CAM_ASM_000453 /LENGTH=93 /DNA_ID=CAMNT_0023307317 /DNA_START=141 /DNA_END=420 /DNA_ORIENTATION=-